MDYSKITLAVISAVCTLLSLFGVITTEESSTLISTGSTAAVGVIGFVTAIIGVVKAHKKAKKEKAEKE